MKRIIVISLCIATMFTVPAFSKTKKKAKLFDCSKAISEAISYYNNGKYARVKTLLDKAKVQCSGSPVMDSILYYLAMSELKDKYFIEARANFELLAQDYPNSPFHQEAQFRIGYAVFKQSHSSSRDQAETKEAISIFRDYLDYNPDGEVADSVKKYLNECYNKLAEKDFNAANFYIKIHELESAVVSFKTFIQEHSESGFVDQARLITADLLMQLDRKSESREFLDALIQNSTDQVLISKAHSLLKKLK